MPLNIVRPFISPGISQHFHNKNQFMRSESFECLTLLQPQFKNACQKGVSSLFAEESTWSTAMRSNSPCPSLLSGKNLCFNKMLFIIIKRKICIFLFLLWNVISWPKKHLRESPVILVLQWAHDPVITAGKIQLHSSTAGLSDKSRCETSQPGWHWQTALTILFLLYNCYQSLTSR